VLFFLKNTYLYVLFGCITGVKLLNTYDYEYSRMLDAVFHVLCVHLGLDLQLKEIFTGTEKMDVARFIYDAKFNNHKIEELCGFVAGCDNSIITNNENTQESLYTFFF
jgi:hypothetical protein